MSEVTDLTTVEAFEQAIASPQGAIIDFHAEWCGPCKMISPKFKTFAKNYDSIKFYAVDVDALPEVAAKCDIQAMPTFQVWRDGEKAGEMKGAVPANLEKLIKEQVEVSKANMTDAAPAAETEGASAS